MPENCGAQPRVLVVDDDAKIRKLLITYLARENYNVVAACNGVAALRVLSRDPVDVVLTDIRMAEMDGEKLLLEIREHYPDLPVVMMTAYRSDEGVLRCIREGASRFLTKPLQLSALRNTLHEVILERREKADVEKVEVRSDFRNWVELVSPSAAGYLPRLEHLVRSLYETRLEAEEIEDLRLVIGEICANAVEWGNRSDASRSMRVSYCLFPGEVVFKVEDEGEGFDPESVPDPTADPLENFMRRANEGKRIGGYGLSIVRRLMDNVLFNEKGNVVVMSKFV